MKEITFDVWSIVSELIQKTPGLLIDRDKFLRATFADKLNDTQLTELVDEGNYINIPSEILDSAANLYISKTRLMTSGASFTAGLPSNLLALPATVSADAVQSFAFYIRIAQQLAYIYGEKNNFTATQDEERMTIRSCFISDQCSESKQPLRLSFL